MMDDSKIDIDGTLDEHRACMRVVSEVEECLGCQPDRDGAWVGRLQNSLTKLSRTMRAHFEAEEQEPLFRDLPATQPQFAERLARLESEHRQMLEELDAVMAKANNLLHKDRIYEQREVNGLVQLLIAKIRRHEAEENEILIEAHWDEVGVGD